MNSRDDRSHAWPALQTSANALSAVIAIIAIVIACGQAYDDGALTELEQRIDRLEQQQGGRLFFDDWPPAQNTDPVPWWRPQGRESRGKTKTSSPSQSQTQH